MNDKQKYISLRNKLKIAMTNGKHNNTEYQIERSAIIKKIFTYNHKKHFLSWSLDNPDLISYYKSETRPYKARYDSQLRTKTRLGRYLTKEFGITNGNLSHWVTQVQGQMAKDINLEDMFSVISGNAITEAYDNEYGGESCMTGSSSEYTELYAENPKHVELLLFSEEPEEEPTARAIIWTCNCGTRLMDRIYPNEGKHIGYFEMWARRHNVLIREDNSLPEAGRNVHTSHGTFEVTLQLGDNDYIPFLDTFISVETLGGSRIILYNTKQGYMNTWSTEGGPLVAALCTNCGCAVSRDEQRTNNDGEVYCEDCYCDLYTICSRCDDEILREEAEYIEDVGEDWCSDCTSMHATQCPNCESYFSDDHLNDHGGLCSSCAQYRFICDNCEEVCDLSEQSEYDSDYCSTCYQELHEDDDDEK